MPHDSPLRRETAIDVWVAGYLHLRKPIDSTTIGSHNGLPYARYPLGTRPVEAEFFVFEPEPSQDAARADASGFAPHWLTVFERGDTSTEAAYGALGYSLDALEHLLVRPLGHNERFAADERVQRITDPAVAQAINAAYGYTAFVAAHFADPAVSVFGIVEDAALVAWGANVWAHAELPYVSRVYTAPSHRGRGLATRIMGELLREAAERGAQASVLSATEMARSLYARLGYHDIATMRIWRSEGEKRK